MKLRVILPFFIFILINFVGLALGSVFTGPGVASDWYQSLPTAPWTPPGWVFGAAWTTVMIGFSVFLGSLWHAMSSQSFARKILPLFVLSWLFNVGWNPVFFYAQAIEWALAEITLLFVIILLLARLSFGLPSSNRGRWGIVPYLLWLCIAISLNAYPVFVR